MTIFKPNENQRGAFSTFFSEDQIFSKSDKYLKHFLPSCAKHFFLFFQIKHFEHVELNNMKTYSFLLFDGFPKRNGKLGTKSVDRSTFDRNPFDSASFDLVSFDQF